MKRIIPILFISLAFVLAACENMSDKSKFEGQWQLLEVAYSHGGDYDSTVNVKSARVYFRFQSTLGQIRPGSFSTEEMGGNINMHFRRTSKRLKLYDFYAYNYESALDGKHDWDTAITDSSTTLLQPFGIDGIYADFCIEKLTGSDMVLRSDYARLTFRRF
jgi:hypothetical protein